MMIIILCLVNIVILNFYILIMRTHHLDYNYNKLDFYKTILTPKPLFPFLALGFILIYLT